MSLDTALKDARTALKSHSALSHISLPGTTQLDPVLMAMMEASLAQEGVDTGGLAYQQADRNSDNIVLHSTSQPGLIVKIIQPEGKGIFAVQGDIHHPLLGPGKEFGFPSTLLGKSGRGTNRPEQNILLRVEKELLTERKLFGDDWEKSSDLRNQAVSETARTAKRAAMSAIDLHEGKSNNLGFWPKGVPLSTPVQNLSPEYVQVPHSLQELQQKYDVHIIDPGAVKFYENQLPDNFPQEYRRKDPRFAEVMSGYRAGGQQRDTNPSHLPPKREGFKR